MLIGIGVAAVLAAVIGTVVGGSGGSAKSGSGGGPTAAASNADVAALFPNGYTKASSAPQIPGMTLSDPVAMAPPGAKGDQSVVVGQVKQGAANPTLLPAGFLQALGLGAGEVPPRAAVKLSRGKLQAYRYENLRPRGLSKPVTIFTTPTSAGIATVACVDPTADCEAIANTLKLNAGTAFPVGPNKDYAAALGKTLGGLDKKASSAHTALQGRRPRRRSPPRRASSRPRTAARRSRSGPEGVAGRRVRQLAAGVDAQADRDGVRRPRVGGEIGQQGRLREGEQGGAGSRRRRRGRAARAPGRGLQDRGAVSAMTAPITPRRPSRNRKFALHLQPRESARAGSARK